MKTFFTAAELMTIAVKEIEMCVANGEKIPREWWCFTHDIKVSEWDFEKHKDCQMEEEGQWL